MPAAEVPAAVLDVTVSYLRRAGGRLHVGMLAGKGERCTLPRSEDPLAIFPLTGSATAAASPLRSIKGIVLLNAIHARLFHGAPAAGWS